MERIAREALRYLGASGADEALHHQALEAAHLAAAHGTPRWRYAVFDVQHAPEGVALPGAGLVLPGNTAGRMLAECSRAVLLLCTLGLTFDSWLRTLQKRDMALAALADGCGSALVEQGCDRAQEEIAARFPDLYLTDRFSPGYGDLPLCVQPALCRAAGGGSLGVYVTESYLMNPQKTVSAVIGLADTPQRARIRGCAYCALRSQCTMRKEGSCCDA